MENLQRLDDSVCRCLSCTYMAWLHCYVSQVFLHNCAGTAATLRLSCWFFIIVYSQMASTVELHSICDVIRIVCFVWRRVQVAGAECTAVFFATGTTADVGLCKRRASAGR